MTSAAGPGAPGRRRRHVSVLPLGPLYPLNVCEVCDPKEILCLWATAVHTLLLKMRMKPLSPWNVQPSGPQRETLAEDRVGEEIISLCPYHNNCDLGDLAGGRQEPPGVLGHTQNQFRRTVYMFLVQGLKVRGHAEPTEILCSGLVPVGGKHGRGPLASCV